MAENLAEVHQLRSAGEVSIVFARTILNVYTYVSNFWFTISPRAWPILCSLQLSRDFECTQRSHGPSTFTSLVREWQRCAPLPQVQKVGEWFYSYLFIWLGRITSHFHLHLIKFHISFHLIFHSIFPLWKSTKSKPWNEPHCACIRAERRIL